MDLFANADTAPELWIGSTRIALDTKCYVIAEIGHNHGGDIEVCKKLFDAAKHAGANAVKLQKRDIARLYTTDYHDQPYVGPQSYGKTYGEHRQALEFDSAEYRYLQSYAQDLGLAFFATPFDIASANLLADMGVPAFKIASGDLRSTPLVLHVARFGLPILISTGGAAMEDVDRIVEAVLAINPRLALLQCTSSYPTTDGELDLEVVRSYRRRFPGVLAGWSAHDKGIEFAPVAYALGARIIEKHLTLDHSMPGTDHQFSLEPADMLAMVRLLERTRIALGLGVKRIHDSEWPALRKLGKKLVAARDMQAGHKLRGDDLEMRSPGDGLWPTQLCEVVGQTLLVSLPAGKTLTLEMLQGDVGPGNAS
jgi:N-acetylneuraminate synthase/sialic acid synthase